MSALTVVRRYIPAMGSRAIGGTHRVTVLVIDGVGLAEVGQATDVFRAAAETNDPDEPRYDVVLCAPTAGRVRSREGYDLDVPAGLDALAGAGTVVLPGCRPLSAAHDPHVVDAVRAAHAGGARVVATCTGVALAAAAGLLNGRTATTHWSHADAFAGAHPDVVLTPGVLYVDHGDVVTGAGTGAGLDVYLHLVRTDHGTEVAAAVARRLVSPRQRDGARPQLLADPVPANSLGDRPDPLAVLLEHLAAHLQDREPIAAVAARLGLSERTLRRRFADQLGTTPGRWLAIERLRQAQQLLETTDVPVETIARRLGLTSATALRRQFRRELATTPSHHRATNRTSPPRTVPLADPLRGKIARGRRAAAARPHSAARSAPLTAASHTGGRVRAVLD